MRLEVHTGTTGQTLYAIVYDRDNDQYWDVASELFTTWDEYDTHKIALTETIFKGWYAAALPTGLEESDPYLDRRCTVIFCSGDPTAAAANVVESPSELNKIGESIAAAEAASAASQTTELATIELANQLCVQKAVDYSVSGATINTGSAIASIVKTGAFAAFPDQANVSPPGRICVVADDGTFAAIYSLSNAVYHADYIDEMQLHHVLFGTVTSPKTCSVVPYNPVAYLDAILATVAKTGVYGGTLESLADTISNLNDLDATDVETAAAAALNTYDPPTATELTNGLAALNDLDGTAVQAAAAAALTAYDPPTKGELDSSLAALNDVDGTAVQAAAAAALTAYDPPTKGELDAGLAALNDLDGTAVQAAAAAALTAYDPPTATELTNGLAALNDLDGTAVQAAAAAALTAYDPPTKGELDAGLVALAGADADTLKTLSDEIAAVQATAELATVESPTIHYPLLGKLELLNSDRSLRATIGPPVTDISVTAADWDDATRTLTEVGAFANYIFRAGDTIDLTAGTAVVPAQYTIASRTSDDAIVLTEDITEDDTDVTDNSVVGLISTDREFIDAVVEP